MSRWMRVIWVYQAQDRGFKQAWYAYIHFPSVSIHRTQYNQIQGIQVRRVDESESPLKEWPFYVVQRRYKLGATDKFSNLPAPWVSREDQHDAIRDTKAKTWLPEPPNPITKEHLRTMFLRHTRLFRLKWRSLSHTRTRRHAYTHIPAIGRLSPTVAYAATISISQRVSHGTREKKNSSHASLG